MNILFAAPRNAWGGFLDLIQTALPQHRFEATGRFHIESLAGFDVLIPTMSAVTKEVLATGDRLRLIQQCGSGLEMVDIKAAGTRNIWVANVPTDISGNADSVAELGIFLMIGLSRDMHGMASSLHNRKMGEPRGQALRGKRVGVIGLGGIGKALIRRLQAFDVSISGLKRSEPERAQAELGLEWVGRPEDLPALLAQSDYVFLSLPATPENRHIINRTTLSHMKNTAFLINLSRGGLVEKTALQEALAAGRIAGAGLDVFWEEPPDPTDVIFTYNVIATPHIAGSTDVSVQGIVQVVADNIRRVGMNQTPLYTQT